MSDKDAIIELVRRMWDDATAEEIIAALTARKASERPADELEYSDEELTEDDWRRLVSYSLRDELSDPRDDVYTLEYGQSENEVRDNP